MQRSQTARATIVTSASWGAMLEVVKRPYVTRLHVEGFGCIQDATFELTPLHALIGPNDSGKSTALRALRALSLYVSHNNACGCI